MCDGELNDAVMSCGDLRFVRVAKKTTNKYLLSDVIDVR